MHRLGCRTWRFALDHVQSRIHQVAHRTPFLDEGADGLVGHPGGGAVLGLRDALQFGLQLRVEMVCPLKSGPP